MPLHSSVFAYRSEAESKEDRPLSYVGEGAKEPFPPTIPRKFELQGGGEGRGQGLKAKKTPRVNKILLTIIALDG